jgi:transcriptional regulator with XRE-family HTH domain
MSLNTDIGKRLLEVRNRLGLTQDEIARKIGISRPLYVGYENGTGKGNVSKKSVEKVIRNLNINEEWLFSGKGDMIIIREYPNVEKKQTIEESISPNYNIQSMNAEVEYLRKQVDQLMSTVQDQAASIRDYAAAEKENAKSRANLTDTVIVQAHAIANLTGKASKNGTVGG